MNLINFNQGDEFKVDLNQGEVIINGKAINYKLIQPASDTYLVIHDKFSVLIEVKSYDSKNKEFTFKVNHKTVKVSAKTELDQLLEKMGLNKNESAYSEMIFAPMPGLILDVLVKEGQEIKAGDSLIVLEAMKMENILKSHIAGVVRKIKVAKGDTVIKKQILIEF